MKSSRNPSIVYLSSFLVLCSLILLPIGPTFAEEGGGSFRNEDVTVPTGDPAVTLAGTLSLPPGDGPHPGVHFLTGSGGHTRDQVISGTPMLRVLGDYLASRGLAVLRLDDRGAGDSTGPHVRQSTMTDRATGRRPRLRSMSTPRPEPRRCRRSSRGACQRTQKSACSRASSMIPIFWGR